MLEVIDGAWPQCQAQFQQYLGGHDLRPERFDDLQFVELLLAQPAVIL
jgi:hypothetical protein